MCCLGTHGPRDFGIARLISQSFRGICAAREHNSWQAASDGIGEDVFDARKQVSFDSGSFPKQLNKRVVGTIFGAIPVVAAFALLHHSVFIGGTRTCIMALDRFILWEFRSLPSQ